MEDGGAVLDALKSKHFDVVLMDVQMTEVDGCEATRRVREHERITGAHIAIVGVTGETEDGDNKRCIEAGMDAYLPKPVQPFDLARILEDVSQSRHRSQR